LIFLDCPSKVLKQKFLDVDCFAGGKGLLIWGICSSTTILHIQKFLSNKLCGFWDFIKLSISVKKFLSEINSQENATDLQAIYLDLQRRY
jgi:hypothetical protein